MTVPVLSRRYATAAAPWSPLDLSPSLWLRADLGITTSGSDVTAWDDQSGNGNDFGTGANSPDFRADIQNGKPSVTFAASDTLDWPGGTLVQSFTMYVVVWPTGLLYTQPFLISADTAVEFRFENDLVQVFAGATAVGGAVTSALTILEYIVDGAASYIGINGAGGAALDMGAFDGGGGYVTLGSGGFTGDIAEIIIVNSVVSAGDRETARLALASYYDISGVT